MKKGCRGGGSASAFIEHRQKINELGDWRGKMLAKVRAIIHKADPEIVEEWKWMGTPVFSHGGHPVCPVRDALPKNDNPSR